MTRRPRNTLLAVCGTAALALAGGSCSSDKPASEVPNLPQRSEAANYVVDADRNDRPVVPRPTTDASAFPGAGTAAIPTSAPAKVHVRVQITARLDLEGRNGADRQLLPRVEVVSDKKETVTLGTPQDGTALTFSPLPAEDTRQGRVVPVRVNLRMWGRRYADRTWTVRVPDGDTRTLFSGTESGDRVRFIISLVVLEEVTPEPEVRPAPTRNPNRPPQVNPYGRPMPPLPGGSPR